MAVRLGDRTHLLRGVPAGFIDALCAAASSFAVGMFAASSFDPTLLGVYAFCFSAFVMFTMVPTQVFFVPAEVWVVARGPNCAAERVRLLAYTLPRSVVPVGAAGLLLCGVTIVGVPALLAVRVSPNDGIAIAASATLCALVSPMQDHLRRLLHAAGIPWRAACVSMICLATTVSALVVLPCCAVGVSWIPFGSLAVANAVSLGVGIAGSTRNGGGRPLEATPSIRGLLRSGKSYLASALVQPLTGFLTAALVGRLAGVDTLGFAEAARIVGQPIYVLAVGMSAVLHPRSVEAAAEGNRREAERVSRLFVLLLATSGALYLGVFGFPWAGNLLGRLVPVAYDIQGLAAISIVAAMALGLSFPIRSELMGGQAQGVFVLIEAVGNCFRVIIAAAAGLLGSFAIPLGLLVLALIRYFRYQTVRDGLYVVQQSRRGCVGLRRGSPVR